MLNILWICNIAPPEAAEIFRLRALPFGGWFVSASALLAEKDGVSLSVAFPEAGHTAVEKAAGRKITYYAFPPVGNASDTEHLRRIIGLVRPDIVHIFGTEYSHTLAALKCADIRRCVVNLQGLVSICQLHYFCGLPLETVYKFTLRDLIRRDNIALQRRRFIERGGSETEALRLARHVIGRTEWDYACAVQINPLVRYHFCNEILREEFYRHTWDMEKCEPYSIFTSQGGYPIKGLHFLLEAMPLVLRRFPQAKLYVGGPEITRRGTLREKLLLSSYGRYIGRLIRKYGLEDKVIFTGLLGEKAMCARMLASNVFVSPSSVENESNSLSEAKIMGVPCVASFAGGVAGRVRHGEDGLLYQHDAPYMLAFYICRIFESREFARRLSENAAKNAREVNDPETNLSRLLQIYGGIVEEAELAE